MRKKSKFSVWLVLTLVLTMTLQQPLVYVNAADFGMSSGTEQTQTMTGSQEGAEVTAEDSASGDAADVSEQVASDDSSDEGEKPSADEDVDGSEQSPTDGAVDGSEQPPTDGDVDGSEQPPTDGPVDGSEPPSTDGDVTENPEGTEEDLTDGEEGEKEEEEKEEVEEDGEIVYATEFSTTFGNGTATVTLTDEQAMPAAAQFKFDEVSDTSSYYYSAYDAVDAYCTSMGKVLIDASVFDAGFSLDGEEIEPASGSADVSVQFNSAIDFEIAELETATVKVFHVTGSAQDVTGSVDQTADQAVSGVSFTVSSFSPIVVAAYADAEEFMGDQVAVNSTNVFTDPVIEFRNNGEAVDSVKSGQAFVLHTELGIAQNNANDISEITVDLTGYEGLVLTQFPGKGKVSEEITITDSGIKVRLDVQNGKKVFHITRINGEKFENGATYTLDLGASFPNGTTANGENATATLKGGDTVLGSDAISATSEPKWTHAKTSNISETTLTKKDGNPKLSTDLEYYLYNYGTTYSTMKENRNPAGNTNYNNVIGELYVQELTVTDTLMLPEGMYLEEVSDAAVTINPDIAYNQGWTNVNVVSKTPVKNAEGRITGVTITYTVKATDAMKGYQLAGSKLKVTISTDKLKFDETYKTGKVSNELDTTYKTVDGASHTIPEKAKVDVTINKPREINWENAVSKSIETSTAQGSNYVTGDLIKYKIAVQNNGSYTQDISQIVDVPGMGLELVSREELDRVNQTLLSLGKNILGNEVAGMLYEDNGRAEVNYDGTVSLSANNVPAGQSRYYYVIMKVTGESEQLQNNIKIGENVIASSTATKAEETKELSFTKSQEGCTDKIVPENGEFYYVLEVKNTGTVTVENLVITDPLPAQLKYDTSKGYQVEIHDTYPSGTSVGRFTHQPHNNKVFFENIKVTPNGSVKIKIPVVLNEQFTGEWNSITNEAYLDGDDLIHHEASYTVYKKQDGIGPFNFEKKVVLPQGATGLAAGDEFTYQITAQNTAEIPITFTEEKPMVITDILPEGVEIVSLDNLNYNDWSGNVTAESTITADGKTQVVIKYVGKFYPGSKNFDLKVKIKDDVTGTIEANTITASYEGESKAPVSSEPIVIAGKLDVEKVVKHENGEPLGDTLVNAGEILTFEVTVRNPSTVAKDSFSLYDEMQFKYESINPYPVIIVSEMDGVTGLAVGDTIPAQWNAWSNEYANFTINVTKENTPEFSIAPGGYLTLQYAVKTRADMTTGKNKAEVEGRSTTVEFTATAPELKIEKGYLIPQQWVATHNGTYGTATETFIITNTTTKEELQAKDFWYQIRLTVGSDPFNGPLKIVDTPASGMSIVADSVLINDKIGIAEQREGYLVNVDADGKLVITNANAKIENTWGHEQIIYISYKAKLKDSEIDRILSIVAENEKAEYVISTQRNVATLTSDKVFKGPDGSLIHSTSDSQTIEFVEDATHASVIKSADGFWTGDGTVHNFTTSTVVAGNGLIWTIKLTNDGEQPILLEDVVDTLPSNYVIDEATWDETAGAYVTTTGYKGSEIQLLNPDGSYKAGGTWHYFNPTVNGDGTVTWSGSQIMENMTVDNQKLSERGIKPGESILIRFLTRALENKNGTFTNSAKVKVSGTIFGETIGQGNKDGDYIENNASVSINALSTSSYKTIEYTPINANDPPHQTGSSLNESPGNYVQGKQTQPVTYTLNIKNTSKADLDHIVIIDRLPFVGDRGVISDYQRGSAFDVYYKGNARVSEGTINKIEFSTDKYTILQGTGDSPNDIYEWSSDTSDQSLISWGSAPTSDTHLVRFELDPKTVLKPGETITITFEAIVPADAVTGENNIAWNNFAYSYTAANNPDNIMTAEPAKVGVWVEKDSSFEFLGELEILKTDENNAPLAGAGFTLFNDIGCTEEHIAERVTGEDGTIQFKGLQKGTYYLKETKVPDGYKAPDPEIIYVVTVDEVGTTTVTELETEVDLLQNGVLTVSNERDTVTPVPTQITLSATKSLEGKTLTAGMFSFVLIGADETVLQTKTNAADGSITFDAIPYEEAGTYTYTVNEVTTGDKEPGVTYDTSVYTVTVEVTDNNGQLVAGAPVIKKGAETAGTIEFANRYVPGSTSVSLSATKSLTGKALTAGMFSFELKDDKGKVLDTKTNAADGSITFDAIPYKEAGTYIYTVNEVTTGDKASGVTYDASVYTVTVEVTDNNGQLVAGAPVIKKGAETAEAITFANTYAPKAVSVSFEVKKVLEGRELKANDFEFELKEKDSTEAIKTAKNDKDGIVKFQNAVTFNEEGKYYYTITEKEGTIKGITYDTTPVQVEVEVTDNAGQLEAVVRYNNVAKIPVITNRYQVSGDTEAVISATKTLSGRQMKAGEFKFVLTDMSGNPVRKAYNDANGKVEFEPITYKEIGETKYILSEENGGKAGVGYDTKTVEVTVTVSDDGEGGLKAEVKYDNSVAVPKFENSYSASSADITIGATKELSGRKLEADQFEFTLTQVDEKGASLSSDTVLTAKNDENGNVVFDKINYQTAGTYYYILQEVPETKPGYTYATNTVKVIVTVTDDGEGKLVASATYDGSTQRPVFKNTYSAEPTTASFSVKKELSGRPLNANEFEFELLQNDQVIQTAKNDADGNVKFNAIPFAAVGKQYYMIKEKKGSLGGITYDQKTVKVEVDVTDAGNGKLVAKVTYDDKETVPVFKNKYKASGFAEAFVEANKVLNGRPMEKEEFTFNLYDSDGKLVATDKNDENGKVKIGPISHKSAGEHHYTLKEVDQSILGNGITYDQTIIAITIKVTDNLQGGFDSEVIYETADGEPLDEEVPTFTNSYAPDKTSVTLEAEKTLAGYKDMPEDYFAFKLVSVDSEGKADGKVSQTAYADKFGKIRFTPVEFETVGTYRFKMSEEAKADAYIYDTAQYDILIHVTDNLKGKLVAEVEMMKAGEVVETMKFVNKKTSISFSKVDITDQAELPGATIQIIDKAGNIVAEWISGTEPKEITGLTVGAEYTLKETVAPEGYAYIADTKFVINADGSVTTELNKTVDEDGNEVFLVEDAPLKFQINKTDLGNGEEVDGAEITIYDSEGNVVDSWISEKGKTHDFGSKLKAGEKYTLKETVAPEGYAYIADTEFTVNKDGSITTSLTKTKDEAGNDVYLVKDAPIKFEINKTDIVSGEEVEGAEIIIYDSEGNEVDKWISKAGETHDFGSKLKAGETYTLKETVAPEGYAYITDTEFTVNRDGSITTSLKQDEKNNDVYLVEDAPIKFEINKTDLENGDEVEGAEIKIYDSLGNIVDQWVSVKGKTHDFGPKLKAGETYTLKETVAPDGYTYISDTVFSVDKDGKIKTKLNKVTDENGNEVYLVEDDITEVSIRKINSENSRYLKGAVLRIEELDGTLVEEWVTDGKEHIIKRKLGVGKTYRLVEVKAPAGFYCAKPILFTVEMDGTTKKPVMMIDLKIPVEDSDEPEVPEQPTPQKPDDGKKTEKGRTVEPEDETVETEGDGPDGGVKADRRVIGAARTGDESHMLGYMAAMFASFAGVFGYTRKRRKDDETE